MRGPALDAIASNVEPPGQTLVITLTPRAKVPLMQLMQLLQIEVRARAILHRGVNGALRRLKGGVASACLCRAIHALSLVHVDAPA
jgi:hypothetical protein